MILNGKIKERMIFDSWFTPCLENKDGLICPLFRIEEMISGGEKALSVRYWITDTETSLEDAQKGAVLSVMGCPVADMEANEYSYSEYTSGCDYDTNLKIGGHDLQAELESNKGKWIWLDIQNNVEDAGYAIK